MLHITTVQTQNTARTDWILPYNDWLTSSVADHDPCLIDTLFTDNNWHAPHWQMIDVLLTDNSASRHRPHFPCWTFDCADRNKDSLTCSAASGRTGASAVSSVWGSYLSGPWCSTPSPGCTWKKKYLLQWSSPVLKIKVYPEFWDIIKVFLHGKPRIPPSPTQVLALKVNHNSKLLACQFLLLSG